MFTYAFKCCQQEPEFPNLSPITDKAITAKVFEFIYTGQYKHSGTSHQNLWSTVNAHVSESPSSSEEILSYCDELTSYWPNVKLGDTHHFAILIML